jgi:hypothetical protein
MPDYTIKERGPKMIINVVDRHHWMVSLVKAKAPDKYLSLAVMVMDHIHTQDDLPNRQGWAWPTRETLSEYTGKSVQRVTEYTTDLVNKGWLIKRYEITTGGKKAFYAFSIGDSWDIKKKEVKATQTAGLVKGRAHSVVNGHACSVVNGVASSVGNGQYQETYQEIKQESQNNSIDSQGKLEDKTPAMPGHTPSSSLTSDSGTSSDDNKVIRTSVVNGVGIEIRPIEQEGVCPENTASVDDLDWDNLPPVKKEKVSAGSIAPSLFDQRTNTNELENMEW